MTDAQIAALNVSQSISNYSSTKVTSGSRKQKSNITSSPKVELEEKRLIFYR